MELEQVETQGVELVDKILEEEVVVLDKTIGTASPVMAGLVDQELLLLGIGLQSQTKVE
jgi:hypothetical protein